MPGGSLQVDLEGLVNALVVQFAQDILGPECLSSTNSGNDFLGNATTFGSVLEGQPGTSVNFILQPRINGRHVLHVGRNELVHDTTGDGDTGENGGHRQCQTP